MPLHVLAWEEYLAGLGIAVDDLERRMHGRRNAELVSDLIASDLGEEEVFRHGAAKEHLFREMLGHEDVSKYEVEGLKEFLARHKSVPKAVASNAEAENIKFVLKHYGLQKYFEVTVNGMEVERPKPFPDVYLKAAKELDVPPDECIVFEDSPTGLEAGLGAGMRVVGIETTPGSNLEGAALKIRDFTDPKLENWLSGEMAAKT